MRIPRLNRRQKIVRNLFLAALALFLLAWSLDFPPLTKAGLLRRAERSWLLAEPSELLFEKPREFGGGENGVLVARNGDRLLTVNYYRYLPELMTLQLSDARCYGAETDFLFHYDAAARKDEDYYYPGAEVYGFLENVASAELELTIDLRTIRQDGTKRDLEPGTARETYHIRGERQNPWWFTFTLERKYPEDSPGAEIEEIILSGECVTDEVAVLRLYDETGALLAERTYVDMGFSELCLDGWEETP